MRITELEAENASLRSIIVLKDLKIEELETKIKELTERLNKNSSNSHKPPSSDGYGKKPGFSKNKGGKQGGQTGNQGVTLLLDSTPDVVIPLPPTECVCRQDLSNEAVTLNEQRQVHDIPKPKKEVTAFQQYSVICPCCGKINKGQFPYGVNSPVRHESK